jgi:nicotinamidase-related amidase
MASQRIALRTRSNEARAELLYRDWDIAQLAVVVCDMWDAHHCVSAQCRVDEMAPHMNKVLDEIRRRGALIVHAPSDCMAFYRDTRARARALAAPAVRAPAPIDWNDWHQDELEALPTTLTDPGSCSCDSPEACGEQFRAWTRQTPLIDIRSEDTVSDDGQEIFNVLHQHGIRDVLAMGVHTNVCVLGRPFGIRQFVYLGMRPVLCRDLTDAFHRDRRGHLWGTDTMIAHIERRWCPSLTSDQLVGGVPFEFS